MEMKRNRRNNLVLTLSILIVIVVGITIVYAALSASLKVSTSNITQNVVSWNVGFEVGTGTVKGETYNPNSSTAGISCENATVTSNSISIGATTLTKPGDACYWRVTIENNGTIDAKLTSIQTTAPSGVECTGMNTGSIFCGNVRYYIQVPFESNAMLQVNTIISAGTSKTVDFVAQIPTANDSLASKAITHTGMGFTLVWSQN